MADPHTTSILLKIASHNTQGLNSPIKWRKVFNSYRSPRLDIVLLQETHFPVRYNPLFLHTHYLTFHLANVEEKTREVAVLFSKNRNFTWQLDLRDPEGRYIQVKGTIEGHPQSFARIDHILVSPNLILPLKVPPYLTSPGWITQ